jgi:hypothetical protein
MLRMPGLIWPPSLMRWSGAKLSALSAAPPVARIVPEAAWRQAEIDQVIAAIRAPRRKTGRITREQMLSWRHEGRGD